MEGHLTNTTREPEEAPFLLSKTLDLKWPTHYTHPIKQKTEKIAMYLLGLFLIAFGIIGLALLLWVLCSDDDDNNAPTTKCEVHK